MSKTIAYNIDCMEYMATLPDKAFGLALVDPPYGIGASRPSDKSNLYVYQKNGNKLLVEGVKHIHKDWDIKAPSKTYFKELVRVSKNQIIWGINYMNILLPSKGRIVWDKLNGVSDQFDGEIAYTSLNNRVDIVYYLWRGMFQGVTPSRDVKKALVQKGNKKLNEKRIHPTQKPVALYEWLLMNYAKKGDKILDTHLGSGSSRIAAHKLGFEFVGCELDKDYFEAQEKRFKLETMQQNLFV